MASTNSSSNLIQSENIPQWKKDLIQRRRQQTKVLANNGASVKLCTAVIGGSGGAETFDNGLTSLTTTTTTTTTNASQECIGVNSNVGGKSRAATTNESHSIGVFPHQLVLGGTSSTASSASATDGGFDHFNIQQQQHTVAGNMRLETDGLCSDTDYDLNTVNKMVDDNKSESRNLTVNCNSKLKSTCKPLDMDLPKICNNNKPPSEFDGESDSSEELQYGPGIVNRLKSKYLNLTLREMNKTRQSVQNFRRATSLEDLLDCDDDSTDKSTRKYTKRSAPGVSLKNERYRNVNRGNDSMKRARSVETLLRYNSISDDVTPHIVPSRFTASIPNHEANNDHIILIDRSSVKIESKLVDQDRPKAVNKPRRVKLVVDETERPPPDLVKTTMRIFEGSTKKLKPKGEVAAKVATFKTINDTFKAQNQKKIIPKPPLQPKPFTNGVKLPSSPKKVTTNAQCLIPTVERLEHPESLRNDGVITEPIVQSVSSVVSKFQQIEKLQSPSQSPEPLCKLKSSPTPSPEPPINKSKICQSESKIKSPSSTPEPRPLPAPRISSPLSPSKDILRQNSTSTVLTPSYTEADMSEESSINVESEEKTVVKNSQQLLDDNLEISKPSSGDSRQQVNERFESVDDQRKEIPRSSSPVNNDGEKVEREVEGEEVVDGGKSVSKIALENIAKAGTTMQFSFNNKKIDTSKSYLPGSGAGQNGQRSNVESIKKPIGKTPDSHDGNLISSSPSGIHENSGKPFSGSNAQILPETLIDSLESSINIDERFEPSENGDGKMKTGENEDNSDVVKVQMKTAVESKPIGAISSLGLMKSMTTTTTSYGQCNDTKTIRSQKTESTTSSPPQKQIGIIRPLVSTKTQIPQQNLSNREMEKNLINRVKSIEQPTKVVVSLKSAEEIQPVKKTNNSSSGGGGGGGLWDTKPWNDQNNTMVFNFSNRKDVPDYIENDGLRVRRKRTKPKAGEGGIIVIDATLDASTTDDAEWEMTGGPPSPCNVSFLNDNILINGRSNLSKQPRNHKHRIQFDDAATRTFEYPSEASMLVGEGSHIGTESSIDRADAVRDSVENRPPSVSPTPGIPSVLGGGGLASYTPSKVDLASEGFELGVTRASPSTTVVRVEQPESLGEVDYLKPAQDAGAWGSETTADLLF